MLAAESLALRHQLGVLGRRVTRPQLRKRDRIFWVWLSKLYWRWKSRKHGRPKIDAEVRMLIRRMSKENPVWGFEVAGLMIAKYLVKAPSRLHCQSPQLHRRL